MQRPDLGVELSAQASDLGPDLPQIGDVPEL